MKVITIVGTAESLEEFEKSISDLLEDPWRVSSVTPLAADIGGKQFLGIVQADSNNELIDSVVLMVANDLEPHFDEVKIHDTKEEAIDWARLNHGEDAYSRFMHPPISSHELRARDFFFALIGGNDMGITRGFLDKEPVVVFVHNSQADDETALMTPFAILVDAETGSRLELPFKSAGSVIPSKNKDSKEQTNDSQ